LLAPRHRPEFLAFVALAVVLKPAVFILLGMYSRLWRYASVRDLIAVLVAVSAASVAVTAGVVLATVTGFIHEFSRAVLINDWLLTLCCIGAVRMAVRVAHDSTLRPPLGAAAQPARRVLVVGAGDAGTMVTREMRRNPQ